MEPLEEVQPIVPTLKTKVLKYVGISGLVLFILALILWPLFLPGMK